MEQTCDISARDKVRPGLVNFFSLPLELRIMIYNLTFRRQYSKIRGCGEMIYFHDMPHLQLLRASHQIRKELLEIVAKRTRLVFDARLRYSWLSTPLKLQYVSQIEIYVKVEDPGGCSQDRICCSRNRARLARLRWMFESSVTLRPLQWVSINLYFGPCKRAFDPVRLHSLLTCQSEFALVMKDKRVNAVHAWSLNEDIPEETILTDKTAWRTDPRLVLKYSPARQL